ncbi:MAG: hypothetical protein ACYTG0_01110 [Planctomycetota bacterium]|jgi:hypothetical protein
MVLQAAAWSGDFYDGRHRRVFGAMTARQEGNPLGKDRGQK